MYEATEAELEWFYTQRPKALGYKPQSFEAGGHAVWDDFKIHVEHMSRRTPRHRRAIERETTVTPTIALLSERSRQVAAAGFTSGGWSFALHREFMLRGHTGSLVRVALLVEQSEFESLAQSIKKTIYDDATERDAARRMAEERENAEPGCGALTVYAQHAPAVRRGIDPLELLERIVALSGGQRDARGGLLQRVRKLDGLRRRAITLYDAVREEYEQLRRARVSTEAQAREVRKRAHEESNAALLAAHRARLRGV